ncbi:MAG TPA: hypothetical protein DDY78_04240 [Planctomycetales bacterium]|nr:hypothetical protein [Planctomycetales bacterium]
MKVKRKKIWIDSFQTYLSLRLALYFALYMITVWAWVVIDRSTAAMVEAHLGPAAVYWSVLSVSVVVLVGLLFIYDIVRFSHRIVGPLYRFRKYLKAIVDGEELALMKLRKDDFLQELKDEFNEVLKVLEERGAVTLKTSAVNEDHKVGVPGPS